MAGMRLRVTVRDWPILHSKKQSCRDDERYNSVSSSGDRVHYFLEPTINDTVLNVAVSGPGRIMTYIDNEHGRQRRINAASNLYSGHAARGERVLELHRRAMCSILPQSDAAASKPLLDLLGKEIADLHGDKFGMVTPSGYSANVVAMVAIANPQTIWLMDAASHNSMFLAARASSANDVIRFKSNDFADLEAKILGLAILPVPPPAVPKARIRVCLSADLTDQNIMDIVRIVVQVSRDHGIIRRKDRTPSTYKNTGVIPDTNAETTVRQTAHDTVLEELERAESAYLKLSTRKTGQAANDVLNAGLAGLAKFGFGAGSARWQNGTYIAHLELELILGKLFDGMEVVTFNETRTAELSIAHTLARPLHGFSRHVMLSKDSSHEPAFIRSIGKHVQTRKLAVTVVLNDTTNMTLQGDNGLGIASQLDIRALVKQTGVRMILWGSFYKALKLPGAFMAGHKHLMAELRVLCPSYKSAMVSYEATVQDFLKPLNVLVHVSGGQPIRESEFFSMTYRKKQRRRSISIRFDRVMNIRFLASPISELLLDYIVYVVPLRQVFLRQASPKALLSPYLWEKDGKVGPEGHLSRYLKEASVRACVPRLHVANWRQITVTIVKTKFASQIECFDAGDGDEDAEEIDHVVRSMTVQRNH
ncbi:hypothetical protein LTR85_012155 [Meristemomyces frigidus]|nr:hypothetical protein LTR85_012155 [Meristemomyces frigidus]